MSTRSGIPPAGWTVHINQISGSPQLDRSAGLDAIYIAGSSHKSIACYRIVHRSGEVVFASLLHAPPFWHVVELQYFDTMDALEAWIVARTNHEPIRVTRRGLRAD